MLYVRCYPDLETHPGPSNGTSAFADPLQIVPQYVVDRMRDNLRQYNMADLGRLAAASQVAMHVIGMEITQGIFRAMEERALRDQEEVEVEVEADGNAMVQSLQQLHPRVHEQHDEATTFMQHAGHGGNEPGQVRRISGRPPWQPRKAARASSRRRRLQRRRRTLAMDVAEWATAAGPVHSNASHTTKRIAEEHRGVMPIGLWVQLV